MLRFSLIFARISPYCMFLIENKSTKPLKLENNKMTVASHGRHMYELYSALTPEAKTELVKRANEYPNFQQKKIHRSVINKGKEFNIPVKAIKEKWRTATGKSTRAKLLSIAKELGITPKSLKHRKEKATKEAKKEDATAAKSKEGEEVSAELKPKKKVVKKTEDVEKKTATKKVEKIPKEKKVRVPKLKKIEKAVKVTKSAPEKKVTN